MKNKPTQVSLLPSQKLRLNPHRFIADTLRNTYFRVERPVIIAVGGPGGTGKTTFCQQLADRLGTCMILGLDHYKTARSSRPSGLMGTHPDANHMDLICAHLQAMRDNQPFDAPVYDDIEGKATSTQTCMPARFNLLDGELAVYPEFDAFVDFKIFIDSDWQTQLQNRVLRDPEKRGYSAEKTVAAFLQSNLRDFPRFGYPAKEFADVVLFLDQSNHLSVHAVKAALYAEIEKKSELIPSS